MADVDSGFRAAAERAAEIRAKRAALLADCSRAPDVSALVNLVASVEDPDVRGLRLLTVLEAAPALGGKVASRRRLTAAGLDEMSTIDAASALGDT